MKGLVVNRKGWQKEDWLPEMKAQKAKKKVGCQIKGLGPKRKSSWQKKRRVGVQMYGFVVKKRVILVQKGRAIAWKDGSIAKMKGRRLKEKLVLKKVLLWKRRFVSKMEGLLPERNGSMAKRKEGQQRERLVPNRKDGWQKWRVGGKKEGLL